MNKDNFEVTIGRQLRNAEAPVPNGAWSAIQAGLRSGSGASSSPSVNFGLGLIIGATILASLAFYSELRQNESNQTITALDSVHDVQMERLESAATIQHISEPNKEINTTEIVQSVNEIVPVSSHILTAEDLIAENKDDSPVRVLNDVKAIPSQITAAFVKAQTTQIRELRERNAADANPATAESIDNSAQNGSENSAIAASAKIFASQKSGYAPLTVKFENRGNGESYWDFGTYAQSLKNNPEVTFDQPGTYTVYLTSSNAEGDSHTDFVEISVKEGSQFFAQDAFTPNGDGVNDDYRITGAYNIKDFLMIITNERGEVEFQTRNINEGWKYDSGMHSRNNARYFVSYRAVGIDGKVYSEDRKPLVILP